MEEQVPQRRRDEGNLNSGTAFPIFRAGWEAAIMRCGGFLVNYDGTLPWEKIREKEFERFWLEYTKVWEVQNKMEEQRVAHKMALLRGSALTIPTEIINEV